MTLDIIFLYSYIPMTILTTRLLYMIFTHLDGYHHSSNKYGSALGGIIWPITFCGAALYGICWVLKFLCFGRDK